MMGFCRKRPGIRSAQVGPKIKSSWIVLRFLPCLLLLPSSVGCSSHKIAEPVTPAPVVEVVDVVEDNVGILGPCLIEEDSEGDGDYEEKTTYVYEINEQGNLVVSSFGKSPDYDGYGMTSSTGETEYNVEGLTVRTSWTYHSDTVDTKGRNTYEYDAMGRMIHNEGESEVLRLEEDGHYEFERRSWSHQREIIGGGNLKVMHDPDTEIDFNDIYELHDTPYDITHTIYYVDQNGFVSKKIVNDKGSQDTDIYPEEYKAIIVYTRDISGNIIEKEKTVDTGDGNVSVSHSSYKYDYPAKGEVIRYYQGEDGQWKEMYHTRSNEQGKLLSEAWSFEKGKPGYVLECEYDKQNNLVKIYADSKYGGESNPATFKYKYDAAGFQIEKRESYGVEPTKTTIVTTYERNEAGKVIKRVYKYYNPHKDTEYITTTGISYNEMGYVVKETTTWKGHETQRIKKYDYSCWDDLLKEKPELLEFKGLKDIILEDIEVYPQQPWEPVCYYSFC